MTYSFNKFPMYLAGSTSGLQLTLPWLPTPLPPALQYWNLTIRSLEKSG